MLYVTKMNMFISQLELHCCTCIALMYRQKMLSAFILYEYRSQTTAKISITPSWAAVSFVPFDHDPRFLSVLVDSLGLLI